MDNFESEVEPVLHEANELPYVIHKRRNSNNYWMRFSVKGFGQQRYALGTDNLQEAHLIAEEKYRETVFKAKHEILEGKTSFSYLADQFVAGLYAEAKELPNALSKARYAESISNRYLKPYFKRKTISSIGTPKVNAYLAWRKIYWTTGAGENEKLVTSIRNGEIFRRPAQKIVPAVSTLKREASVLRGIFKHAVRLGHISIGQIPIIEFERKPKGRRPHFTKAQYNIIATSANQRLVEAFNDSKNQRLIYERNVLFQFIEIAVRSGMRPKEIFQLNWDHLEGFDPTGSTVTKDSKLVLIGYGKGKLPQRSVPKPSAQGNFQNLWAAQQSRFGKVPASSDPVFRNFRGERIGSLKKSLNALLASCDLKYNQFGEAYSAYSFRHSYATWELQKSPPTDVYILSINMRTSPDMIYSNYAHVIADDHSEMLREQGW